MVDHAHSLGRMTVAEGVERPEVLQALRELGCDIAQGYYVGHPTPAADFERWLREEHLAGARALVA